MRNVLFYVKRKKYLDIIIYIILYILYIILYINK